MPSVSRPWKSVASLVLLLLASGASADPPPDDPENGAKLHGTGPLEFVNIPLDSAMPGNSCQSLSFKFDQGNLIAAKAGGGTCSGPELMWASFSAPFNGQTVSFAIQAVEAHRNIITDKNSPEAKFKYRVIWKQAGGPPTPLCSTKNGFALAVPHAWSTAGELIENPKYFTFACIPDVHNKRAIGGGVIAKCIDWGYPPWARPGMTMTLANWLKDPQKPGSETFEYTQQQAMSFHQVCVRMANADYCSEGKTNTLDGTPIKFATVETVSTTAAKANPKAVVKPDAFPGYSLEAIWGIDKCGKVRALCLGKKRWETLSLSATCIDPRARQKLQRPLSVQEVPVMSYAVCEDWTQQDLQNWMKDQLQDPKDPNRALLFSYSAFLDSPLVRFQKNPGFFLNTAAVSFEGKPTMYPYKVDPAQISNANGYAFGIVEGPLFSKKIPDDIKQTLTVKPLYRCRSMQSSDRFLTTDSPTCEQPVGASNPTYTRDGDGDKSIEGYIYDVNAGIENNPLYLWTRQSNPPIYATSTTQPSDEYTRVRLLGYLPPMSQLAELMPKIKPPGGQHPNTNKPKP